MLRFGSNECTLCQSRKSLQISYLLTNTPYLLRKVCTIDFVFPVTRLVAGSVSLEGVASGYLKLKTVSPSVYLSLLVNISVKVETVL